MTIKDNDQILLRKVAVGDEPAYRQLFDKYYKHTTYAAYKICSDQHKCRDIAQDVFLDIWKKRKTLVIHTSLSAFLQRAARNKAIDYVRGQRLDFNEEEDFDSSIQSSEGKLEEAELKAALNEAIANLPERCRLVFSLSRYEGMTYREIANELDISERTVENQISKALRVLRVRLADFNNEIQIILMFLYFRIGVCQLFQDLI